MALDSSRWNAPSAASGSTPARSSNAVYPSGAAYDSNVSDPNQPPGELEGVAGWQASNALMAHLSRRADLSERIRQFEQSSDRFSPEARLQLFSDLVQECCLLGEADLLARMSQLISTRLQHTNPMMGPSMVGLGMDMHHQDKMISSDGLPSTASGPTWGTTTNRPPPRLSH